MGWRDRSPDDYRLPSNENTEAERKKQERHFRKIGCYPDPPEKKSNPVSRVYKWVCEKISRASRPSEKD